MRRTCKVVDCTKGVSNAGWCSSHHNRAVKYGDPLGGPPIRRKPPTGCTAEEAFTYYMGEHPPRAKDCWPWRGTLGNHNYGTVMIGGKNLLAHRISYRIFNGELPDELVVRHTCDNKPCVNPHHLLVGTQADNLNDCRERGRRPVGNQLPFTRLTPEGVRAIRVMASEGVTQKAMADQLGVHPGTIQAVLERKTWKHVV